MRAPAIGRILQMKNLSAAIYPALYRVPVPAKSYVTCHGRSEMRVIAMVLCPFCKKTCDAKNQFCGNCGAPLTPVLAGVPQAASSGTPAGPEKSVEKLPGVPPVFPARLLPAGGAATGEFPGSLSWQRKIPLITNPWLVLQGIFIPLLIGLFLGGGFWLATGERGMLVLFLVVGAAMAILFLAIMAVLQLATGGGLETEFFISSTGVAHRAGTTTRILDRAATAGSLFGGSLSGAGAGLLASSQESTMLAWADVRYISVYRNVRSIVFRSQYLIHPVVLYCTEENFLPVLAMVKQFAPPGITGNL